MVEAARTIIAPTQAAHEETGYQPMDIQIRVNMPLLNADAVVPMVMAQGWADVRTMVLVLTPARSRRAGTEDAETVTS